MATYALSKDKNIAIKIDTISIFIENKMDITATNVTESIIRNNSMKIKRTIFFIFALSSLIFFFFTGAFYGIGFFF